MKNSIKRDPPAREAPIRNVSRVVLGPRRGARAKSTNGATSGGGEGRTAAPETPVERGVQTAYRVYEDYIRRGREAASTRPIEGEGPEGKRPMANDVQSFTRMATRYWSDVFSMWVDFITPFVPPGVTESLEGLARPIRGDEVKNGDAKGGDAKSDDRDLGPWAIPLRARASGAAAKNGAAVDGSGGRINVAVELSSSRPARVLVDLAPHAAGRPLSVEPLRPLAGKAKALSGARFERVEGDGPITVKIAVPPRQAAGTYVGIVLDAEKSLPCGTLTVVISP